jgi:hypothetical protein
LITRRGRADMKTLIKFELYKIFSQKIVYLTGLVLFIITTLFLRQMTGPSLHSFYKKYEGPVSQQDIQIASKEDKAIAEKQDNGEEIPWKELKLRNVYYDVIMVGDYKKLQRDKIKNLQQRMDNLMDHSGYVYRKFMLEKNMIQKIHYSSVYYKIPAAQMLDYLNTYGFVILGVLIVVGLSPIFTQEAMSGVDQYILSSKHGRKTIVHAKLIASLIFVLVILLISVSYDLTFWILADGNYGWKADIHSIDKFWDSPYSMNMLTYLFIKVGFQFIAGCALALFTNFISALCKNPVTSFIINGFVFAFPLADDIFIHFELPSWLNQILNFTFTEILMVDGLFKEFKAVDVFGYPVLYPIFAIFVLLILSFLIVYLLYKVMANKQVA